MSSDDDEGEDHYSEYPNDEDCYWSSSSSDGDAEEKEDEIQYSEREIEQFLTRSKKKVPPRMSVDDCPICLEKFQLQLQDSVVYCSSECGTMFHNKCTRMLRKCPMCRTTFNPKVLRKSSLCSEVASGKKICSNIV